MTADASLKYALPESLERAVESVCASLRASGIRVAGRLDLSGRIQRSLGIALPSCTILFVLPGVQTLGAEAIQPWAGDFLPLHVVISGDDRESEVRIQNRILPGRSVGAATPVAPVLEMQKQVSNAIQAVAARPSMLA